ncbi:hypothetical protein ACJVC5_11625 [Peredibacter sp. HCB2-198]|uniref:hypothetical protein n=1 Tax=Peredibacter sp. HCB2-198 TaxID=3383025 RepID=UPI0038B5B7F4
MKLKLLFVAMIILSFESQARDVVVCRDSKGKITSTEHLDYYEGRVNRGIPHVFDSELSQVEYFTILAEKMSVIFDQKKFLDLALRISKGVTEFRATGSTRIKGFIFTNEKLINSPDYSNVAPVKGCEVEQAFILQEPALAGDPEFVIQKEIVEAMDEDGIRGMILNALIWKNSSLDPDLLRYYHQKLTMVSVHDLNFDHIVQFSRNYLQAAGPYDWRLLKKLPNGDYFYVYYVLDQNGNIDREKTLAYPEATPPLQWCLTGREKKYGIFATNTVMPRGAVITITQEDGTVTKYDIDSNDSQQMKQLKLKPQKIKVTLYVPGQVVPPGMGLSKNSLDYLDLDLGTYNHLSRGGWVDQVSTRYSFEKIYVGMKSVNLTKTLQFGLNKENRWDVWEIK